MKSKTPINTGETWPPDYAEYIREMQSEEWPDDNIELTERDREEDAKREAKLKLQRTKDAK